LNTTNFFRLTEKQAAVRAALCDNFNTCTVMIELRSLINSANIYNAEKQKLKIRPNSSVLKMVGEFVTKMMRVFGVFEPSPNSIGSFPSTLGDQKKQGSSEEVLLPVLQTVSGFRDQIRSLAQNKAEHKDFLKLCDKLRDDDLVYF
jgi:cysteinyl-tRNA synthetase